jgi:hypothetical protein
LIPIAFGLLGQYTTGKTDTPAGEVVLCQELARKSRSCLKISGCLLSSRARSIP